MKFTRSNDGSKQFVQLRTPSSVQDVDNRVTVSFAVKVEEDSPDNQLLYYGDEKVNVAFLEFAIAIIVLVFMET